jgi:hypothetical protein
MFWKNWPYWLKCGVTFGIVGLLMIGFMFACLMARTGWSQFQCVNFVGFPIYLLGDVASRSLFVLFLGQFFIFFIPGAVVGLLFDLAKYIKKIK